MALLPMSTVSSLSLSTQPPPPPPPSPSPSPLISIKHHHPFSPTFDSSSPQQSSSVNNYRPAVILPGLGSKSGDYSKLQVILRDGYGVQSVVPKVSRMDWLRNVTGLADPNSWRGTLHPHPVLDWYFERVDEAVQQAKLLAQQGGEISIIGHSAGGWLARIYMEEFRTSNTSLLLTLGSPLLPPPKGLPGVIDQTRGLLEYVEKHCAKAVYAPEIKYVCIAGRYIKGSRFSTNSNKESTLSVHVNGNRPISEVAILNNMSKSTSIPTTLRSRFIGLGYKQLFVSGVWTGRSVG